MRFGDERLPERFWDKVSPEPNTGCWLWTGAGNPEGYGHLRYGKRLAYAHRLTLGVGLEKTPGLTVDHLCRIPACCNPDHLELIPFAENVRRGNARLNGALNRAKTECLRGHPFSEENTYRHRGQRSCRTCTRRAKCSR